MPADLCPPGAPQAIWVFSLIDYQRPTYDGYHYPEWGIRLGWFLASLSILPIPLCAIAALCQATGATPWQVSLRRRRRSCRAVPVCRQRVDYKARSTCIDPEGAAAALVRYRHSGQDRQSQRPRGATGAARGRRELTEIDVRQSGRLPLGKCQLCAQQRIELY